MNKIFIVIFYTLLFVFTCSAHDVNKYKYFCIDVDENPYGIEQRFAEEFQKMGFFLMDNSYYKQMDHKEKQLVLFAKYSYYINYNGPSGLTLSLQDMMGNIIWSSTGHGCTLFSAKGDMKGASKEILKEFANLHYKFDETLIVEPKIEHPFNSWPEDSIKSYLLTNKRSKIEGIYKNYSNDGDAYNVALLKHNDKYYGIVVETDNELWNPGETKFTLTHIDGGAYDVEYYNQRHKKLNALAGFKEDRILEIDVPNGNNTVEYTFLRIFPTGSQSSSNPNNVSLDCTTSGSGIIFSDSYLITNFHVIENANKIEIVIDINGMPETFNARVLCSDKTNDLAILCIKDDKYKPITQIPFRIAKETVDVGTSVFTMGHPMSMVLGDEVKITDGIISSKTGYDGDIVTYQISAPIQPGNSGGPLFNKNGDLIGITNAGINKAIADNIGYAIKSPYIFNLIDAAPININLPEGENLPVDDLPALIKILRPYVALIKVY